MTDNNEKDALIESLQNELVTLKHQIKQFQDLRMLIVKVTGKNSVKQLKDRLLTSSDRLNASEISHWLRKCLWPHVKLMPEQWHKWSENPKSICQRVLAVVGIPTGFSNEEYWLGVAQCIANKKLCALRSNTKQAMFGQFKVDDLTMHEKVDYNGGKMVPRAQLWIKKKMYKPSFAAAEPLLYFLDKYTTIVVGGMRRDNKSHLSFQAISPK